MEKVMIVGWGGREEALERVISASPLVVSVLRADGDSRTIISLAKKYDITFVVIGPDRPVVQGLADDFAQELPAAKVFAPSRLAAELEGSKIFMKTRCVRWGIPTARFDFAGGYTVAEQIIKRDGHRIIKADGLCDGKGVEVAKTEEEALAHAKRFLLERVHGSAGSKIVIEEFLEGEELSVMALCDTMNAVCLEPARDQKRLRAGSDIMTGGMGAYSPVPGVGQELLGRIEESIIKPLLAGMAKEGRPYRGVLYAGVMLTAEGPKLLEVNCRFGDPETQAVLARLDCDLVPYLLACTEAGGLSNMGPLVWKPSAAVCFCGVSPGYPASGHREISIVGVGPTLAEARKRGLRQTKMHHQIFRDDIAAGV